MNRLPLLLIAELLAACCSFSGCEGPKAAKGATPTYAEAANAYEAEFAAQAAADATTHAKLDQLQATVDLLSTPAEAVPQTGETIGYIDVPLSVEVVPPEPEPAAPEASPKATSADRSTPPAAAPARLVTIDGVATDYDLFVKTWYRGRDVGVRGMTIEKHLGDHGVTGSLAQLSRDERYKLHSALHARDDSGGRSVTRSRTVTKNPPPQAAKTEVKVQVAAPQGCANGQCNLPQMQYRTGLFGRTRAVKRWR